MLDARLRSVLSLTLFIVAAGSGVAAHDFWLEPSTFAPGVDEPVRIHLRIGEHFTGESLARNGSLIEKFVIVGPSGERPVLGPRRHGSRGPRPPRRAGDLVRRLSQQAERGRTRSREVRAVPARRRARAHHPGAGRAQGNPAAGSRALLAEREVAPALRRRSGASGVRPRAGHDARVRARCRSCASLRRSRSGSTPARTAARCRSAGRRLSQGFGRHLSRPNQSGKANDRRESRSKESLRARTDKDGRIVLPVSSGMWLLKSVYMERAAAGSGADWESVWSALTFKVG